MKRVRSIIALFIALLILTSCAEMPDSLKEGETTPAQTVGDKSVEIHQVERGNVETIRTQLDIDLQKKYKNITIERARVGEGRTMPTYDIQIGKDPDYSLKTVVDYLYSDIFDTSNGRYYTYLKYGDPIDNKYPATTEPTLYDDGKVYSPNALFIDIDKFVPSSNDITLSSYVYSTGAAWGSQTGYNAVGAPYYFETYDIAERYDLDYTRPSSDTSYKMYNGDEWNISDAIEYVENFWNTYLAPSDPESYEYNVKTLYVMSLDDDRFGYLFHMQRKDKNGNYYDVDSGYYSDDNAIQSGQPFMIENNLMCWCLEKEVFTRYIKNFSFSMETETDSGDSLLSLSAAADILAEKLAGNINLKLTAELNYVVVCKGYPYYQIWEYPFYYENICFDTCDFEIKPYWCFRTEQCTMLNGVLANIYFVDAVTGSLTTMTNGRIQKR